MNPILSVLRSGPRKYSQLVGLMPAGRLDIELDRLLKSRQIIVTSRGFEAVVKVKYDPEPPLVARPHRKPLTTAQKERKREADRAWRARNYDRVLRNRIAQRERARERRAEQMERGL